MRAPTEIVNQQKRLVEVGRIRLGIKTPKGAPKAIDTFRLTSRNKTALDQAQILWGGKVEPWPEKKGQYQLLTEAKEIPIFVSPQSPSQAYEFYTKAGLQRRCDGQTCYLLKDGKEVPKKCACFSEKDQTEFGMSAEGCKLYTRVQVLLPDIPALGYWLLTTQSWHAGAEIPTSLGYLKAMADAVLAIENRERTVGGLTKKFVVPVIRLQTGMTLRHLIDGELPSESPALPSETFADEGEENFREVEGEVTEDYQESLTQPVSENAGQLLESHAEGITERFGEAEHQEEIVIDNTSDVTSHVPEKEWPVFADPAADQKLMDLGFTPGEAQELADGGSSSEDVLQTKADTKEAMRIALE